jgi:hypothetical protein
MHLDKAVITLPEMACSKGEACRFALITVLKCLLSSEFVEMIHLETNVHAMNLQ